MKKFFPIGVFCLFACLFAGACASRPPVAYTASPMEIIQKAQEATDRDRYRLAVYYYSMLLERFPNDSTSVCTAEYEIAFIHYKQRKYTTAKTEFEALLQRYGQRNNEFLPQEYKVLSNIVLKKINEKIKDLT